jgi:hypothetical protein
MILANLDKSSNRKLWSEVTKVDPKVLDEKVAELHTKGYITAGNLLTEKGFNSLVQARQQGRLGGSEQDAGGVLAAPARELTSLDYTVLNQLQRERSEDSLSKLTGVDRRVVIGKLNQLYSEGYITEKKALTVKGFEALSQAPASYRMQGAKELPATLRVETERSTRVIVGSILTALYGLFDFSASFVFIIGGFVSGMVTPLPELGLQFAAASVALLVLGGILLVTGIAGLICGWWLWRGQRRGAQGGIILAVLGIAITFILGIASRPIASLTTYELVGTVWVCNGFLLLLLVASWPRLD